MPEGKATPSPPNSYDEETALTKAAPLLVPNYQRLSRTFGALSICPISYKQKASVTSLSG